MTVTFQELTERAGEVLTSCRDTGLRIAVAESCTGGLISGCLTAVAGSSDVFDRGFVTYSNEAKHGVLGVPEALLAAHGAVSSEVVRAMAEGTLARSDADLSVAVTGIAGPGGGSAEKPVGLVHVGGARRDGRAEHLKHVFPGDRTAVRLETVAAALDMLERLSRP